mmetsp:Transcript_111615/g.315191  ORF Transcript_111615/g.315191 Transcript_111615/m.315191 type:complete len:260 (-) Transcript_111615:127-906(-)
MSRTRDRIVEHAACLSARREIDEAHPSAVAILVLHMGWDRCGPQLRVLHIQNATHEVLLVVRRKGNDGVGNHCTPQAELWENLRVVGPTTVWAEALEVAFVDGPANRLQVHVRQVFLLHAVAFRVEPPLVGNLYAMMQRARICLLCLLLVRPRVGPDNFLHVPHEIVVCSFVSPCGGRLQRHTVRPILRNRRGHAVWRMRGSCLVRRCACAVLLLLALSIQDPMPVSRTRGHGALPVPNAPFCKPSALDDGFSLAHQNV